MAKSESPNKVKACDCQGSGVQALRAQTVWGVSRAIRWNVYHVPEGQDEEVVVDGDALDTPKWLHRVSPRGLQTVRQNESMAGSFAVLRPWQVGLCNVDLSVGNNRVSSRACELFSPLLLLCTALGVF